MEPLIGIMLLLWLVAAPILAGLFAGTAKRNWLGVVGLAGVAFPAAVLTAIYGWPFGYSSVPRWDILILFPVYISLALTAVIFAIAFFLRRRTPAGPVMDHIADSTSASAVDTIHLQTQVKE